MAALLEQNQINGLIPRLEALEAGGSVSGGTGLLEPLTPTVAELTDIYTRYTFDKQYLNYLYLGNPVTLSVPVYLDSVGKPDIGASRFDLFYIYLPSNSLRIVSGEQAENPALPGVPENSIYVAFALINGDGTSEVNINSTNAKCIYISNLGNDVNLGLTETTAVLTWGRVLARLSDTAYRVVRCVDNSFIKVFSLPFSISPLFIDCPNAIIDCDTTLEIPSNCVIRANRVNCNINVAQGKNSVLFDINTFYKDVTITKSEVRFLRDTAIKGNLSLVGASGEGAIYCNTIWANSFDFGMAMVVQGSINGKLVASNTMFGHTIKDNGTVKNSEENLNFENSNGNEFSILDIPAGKETKVKLTKSGVGTKPVTESGLVDKSMYIYDIATNSVKSIETANISIIDFSNTVLADEKYWRNNFNSSLVPAYAGQTVAGTGNLGTYMEVMAAAGGFVRVFSQPYIDSSSGYGAILTGLLQTSTGWVDGLKTITSDADGRNGDISMKHKFSEFTYECIGRTGTGNKDSIWMRTQNKDAATLPTDQGVLFSNASGQATQNSAFLYNAATNTLTVGNLILTVAEYADNAAALAGGLSVGNLYRTGDDLKIVH